MGHSIGAAHDPSAPAGHLPGFAREEQRDGNRHAQPPRYARMTSGWAWTSAGVPVAIGRP